MKWLWRGRILVAVLLVIGGFVGVVSRSPRIQKWYNPPELVVPTDDEVAEVRAALRESPIGFKTIPEFVVPPEHVSIVLGWLRPLIYESEPLISSKQNELSVIWIRTRSGQEMRLEFYWTGKNPAMITRDGIDYFWGRGFNTEGKPCDGGIGLGFAVLTAYSASKR